MAAYARAGALRTTSARTATTAGQRANIDVLTFLSWAGASTNGKEEFKNFVEHRFRPEFKPIFEKWLATNPLTDPTAPASPFELPEYKRLGADAAQLSAEADRLQQEGDVANAHSDKYSRTTIIFALSLFFIAVAQQFRSAGVRTAVVVTAGLLMFVGVWAISQLPRVMPS